MNNTPTNSNSEAKANVGANSAMVTSSKEVTIQEGTHGANGSQDGDAKEDLSEDQLLVRVNEEIERYLQEFIRATGEERRAMLAKIVRVNTEIEEINKAKQVIAEATQTQTQEVKGLPLEFSDLPKFQLRSMSILPFPGREVFESVDHFLRTFELLIRSANMDIEVQWRNLLVLCLPGREIPWIDTTLLACESWQQVKDAFQQRFGFKEGDQRIIDAVRMMMTRRGDRRKNKKAAKPYYKSLCKQHGRNGTHDTRDW